ncbi:molybdopterin-dependent oxidoreductase [Halpernia frigidisoli]|uniref:Oxidoreductase molybdopterin binding domain-containing protein n=1 Tax=Halpernia frigidisoli TaxID=1125876 RepID=A0A1I3FTC6_9FLAO|nr:molybdopterin-dependent oxidoreductase [Halpernia frigidisoli]SFI14181.1 Oxidoreductase molybdopterin binding domain-containing protein [Halpernia frigidisoli]
MKNKQVSKSYIARTSIISGVIFLIFIFGSVFLFKKLKAEKQDNGTPNTLRKTLDLNEKIANNAFNITKTTRVFDKSEAAKNVRVNGYVGIQDAPDRENYFISIVKNNGDTLKVSVDELKKLPKTEVTFNFKCIEGWSQITNWSGVKFTDFIKAYHLENENALNYVGMSTPDKQYYVGIDHKSMIQPQTILAYEMNGKTLPANQGYPIRLIIPVKYGVKHLKRIGTIVFSNDRPKDYWYERGYDYYCGF